MHATRLLQAGVSLKQLLAPRSGYNSEQAQLVSSLIEELDSRMHLPTQTQQLTTTTVSPDCRLL